MSWAYHPQLLTRPVPRYTSYPTAADFTESVGPANAEAALLAVDPEQPISLYVHIPFCEQICWYCGCNTAAANKAQRLASCLAALHREIDLVASLLPKRMRVSQIALGGGSPNVISGNQLTTLLTHLDERFDTHDATRSVEVDPRALKDEFVAAMAGARVERASLGIQTFSDAIQRRIGRIQPASLISRAIDLLRSAGVSSLNFDLMYGLPGQGMADLQATLAQAVAHAPERIALFGYAHMPHLIPRQRRVEADALPSPEDRFLMASAGHDYLVEAGYRPVGFDHFALPGDPLATAVERGTLRRNFQGFTDDGADTLIGFGPSAISSFPDLLTQNEKNSGRYQMRVTSRRVPAARGVIRSSDDRYFRRIIDALLCQGSAQINHVSEALGPFISAGLVAFDGATLKVLPDGLPYARAIAATFDSRLSVKGQHFSAAV